MLAGKKTYIIAIIAAVLTVVVHLGYINQDIANTLFGLLGAGGLATLRSGIANG
tara:strand:+ start:219 stop:380 length:162 start_codon:yes stop_codon:yes gene_type:complete